MRLEELKKISDSIDNIYCECIKKVISASMQYKYGENAFQEFVRIDKENKENNQSNKSLITEHKNAFNNFDVQACSKTLLFLDDVKNIISEYYNLDVKFNDNNFVRKYKSNLYDLIAFRNNKSHNKVNEEVLSTGIDSEWFIIKNLFPDIVDDNDSQSRTFLSQLNIKRTEYYKEIERTKYYLKNELENGKYDYSRFLDVCKRSNIETDIEDGEYVFYSSNYEEDIKALKNNLKKNANVSGNIPYTPPTPNKRPAQPIQPSQPVKQVQYVQPVSNNTEKNNKKNNKIISIILIIAIIILAIILAVGIGKFFGGNENETTTQATTQSTVRATTDKAVAQTTIQTTTQTTKATTQSKGENEIPDKYSSEVENFKYQDEEFIRLNTVEISVGQKKSTRAAITWKEHKTYSQNTAIAKIDSDGLIVGVKAGVTYVLVESSNGTTEVYKVVVE